MECPRCHFVNSGDRTSCEKCGLSFRKPEELSQTQTLETTFCGLALDSLVAGRYQVLEELGSGGMGKVYKVFDKETRESLALKLLRSDIIRDDKAVERFRNELKIAHQISHRNICRMYHLGREADSFFIIMEYIPGEDLKSFIRRSGQLSPAKAVGIARQVCEGLGEAHRLGIIHRDLKPHNIMIDKDGNAKIMDFGIARSFQEEGLTRAGYAVGTPAYMAPEQVEGKEVDERTDIYALGTVLYEMVTGKPPFQGDTEFSVAYKHIHAEPAHPATLNPLIPEEMSRIILKCLQKDKRNRYQNSAELCAALERMESHISGTQKKVRIGTPEWVRLKGRRKFLAITALVVAAVSLLIFVYLNRGREGSREIQGAESRAQKIWKNSIAVLTFEDLSLDRSLSHICESITDDINTKLGSSGVLKVSSRGSTQLFAGQEKDPREIGKKLMVANILEATLKTQGDQLRVNVNLVRTQDGVYVWSCPYSGTVENILKLEDDISKDVAVQLGVELTAANRERSKRKDPKDNRGYDIFLLGRHFENRYSEYNEEADFRKAVENLRAYIDAHPNYALAYCSLGNVYEHRFAIKDNPEDEDLMRFYYEKAYHLDPELEETNFGMGWAHFYRWNFDRSYEYFKKAVALGPDNPEVNWNAGSFFRSIGLDEKAIPYYEKSLVSDPLNSSIHWLCAASHMYVGQYESGLGSIERAIALDRENIEYLALSARLLLLLKRPQEAELRLVEGEKRQPDKIANQMAIRLLRALISALHGDRERALSLLREMQLLDQTKKRIYDLDLAGIYSLLGMNNEAIQTIEEGIRNGFADAKMELYSYPLLRSYPYFESLRNVPQFKAIERKQEELYEMRKEKYQGL